MRSNPHADHYICIEGGSADSTRSLRAWLAGEDELRGRVHLVERGPAANQLGSLVTGLLVSLAPGGAATALAAVMIAWVRAQRGDVTIVVERPDGTRLSIESGRVRGLDANSIRDLIERSAQTLEPCNRKALDEEPGQ